MMWYMVGMNHLPYQEDFLVLPTVSGRFELCPSKFLGRDLLIRTWSPGHGYSQPQTTACAALHPGDSFHSAKHLALGASTLSESLIRYI